MTRRQRWDKKLLYSFSRKLWQLDLLRDRKPPPTGLTSTTNNPGFESRFPDQSEFGSGCLPDRSQNVDSLRCQCQSFCRVSSGGDWTRNANKSPKIPCFAMVTAVEKWSGIRIRDPTVSQFFRPVKYTSNPNIKFQWNRLITFTEILHANRMIEWQ